jgi:hypothetical protein
VCVARLWADPVANTLPVVFCRRRNPISVVTKANLVGRLKLTQCVLHRGKLGVTSDSRMERRRNVFRRAVNTLHVLEQANHLGDWLCEGVLELLRNCGDLHPDFRADVSFDEVVDLIKPGHGANRLVREVYCRIDKQLLRQLDDRAVCATDMPAGAALRPEPLYNLNYQVDLIRQKGVEIDEAVASKIGQLDVGR